MGAIDLAEDEQRDLVEQAKAGDRTAFETLYARYLDPIYDFTYGMVRNRDDASDVTSSVFLKAMERLGSLKDPEAFRGWLYAIARNEALDTVRRRSRTSAMPDDFEPPATTVDQPPSDPSEAASEAELSALVAAASATLNPRDWSVYDLVVKQGLGSAEVAEALGTKPQHAYVMVSQMKRSVEEALQAVVMARAGRRDCPELDAIVAKAGDELSPLLRKRVSRHLKSCDTCSRGKKRYAVAALVAGAAHAAPASLHDEILERIREGWPADGPLPTGRSGKGRRTARGLVAAGVIAAVMLLGLGAPGARVPLPVAAPETTPTPTASTEPLELPSPEPTPEETTEPTADPSPTPRATRAPTPRPTTPTPAPPVQGPSVRSISFSASPLYAGGCGARTATVTASISAPAGVSSVMMSASKDGTTVTKNMSGGGSSWQSSVGPYATAGTVGVTVSVTDAAGRTASASRSLPVAACQQTQPTATPPPDCRANPNDPRCLQ